MEEFVKVYNDYNYTFQRKMNPKEKILCKIPRPNSNTRRVKSISWSAHSDITVKGTLAYQTDSSYTVWETFKDGAQISPSITTISLENTSSLKRTAFLWVVME